jgi:RecA/RadA recombinase
MTFEKLTADQKDMMLIALVRNPRCMLQGHGLLEPEIFDAQTERYLGVIWAVARDFYRTYARLIPPSTLATEVGSRVANDPEWAFSHASQELLASAIDRIANTPDSDIVPEYGMTLLQAFLDERKVKPAAQALASQGGPKMVEEINRLYVGSRVTDATGHDPFDFAAPDTWTTSSPRLATGCHAFDNALAGGPANKELIGLLGPIGGGKTLLQLQTCVYMARLGQSSCFFTYEQPVNPKVRDRILIGAGRIDRGLIESRVPNAQDPARRMPPEVWEKLQAVQRELAGRIRLFDMTGSDPAARNAGFGGVAEIENIVLQEIHAKRKPRGIFIDWCGTLVDRWMAANNESMEHKRNFILRAIDQCLLLGQRHDMFVVLAHQLSSEAGVRRAGAKFDVYDSSDCKQFGAKVDQLIVVSPLDKELMICNVSNPKSRAGGYTDYWCKVDDRLHQIELAGDKYTYMSGRGGEMTLVKADNANQVNDGMAVDPRLYTGGRSAATPPAATADGTMQAAQPARNHVAGL